MTQPSPAPDAAEAPAVKKQPDRPHERRITANYEALEKGGLTKREEDQLHAALYEDLKSLSMTLFIKKYGYSHRIDMEDIAHSVATSALMTIIQRHKPVYSWVQLLKKMVHDWSCKWMRNNLYNEDGVTLVDIDDVREDEDGEQASYQLPHYDMSAESVSFFFTHLGAIADSAIRIVDGLCSSERGILLARLSLDRALHGERPVEAMLPPYQRQRVNYYSRLIKAHLDKVLDSKKLEAALF
jgi:hypothetical protein